MSLPSLHCDVVILAAGIGKRMRDAYPGLPKVLVPLAGKPMVVHLLDAVEAAGVADRITVVVGPGVEESIKKALAGRNVQFVLQEEQKGTGHAVMIARSVLPAKGNILVLYGDHPLFSAATIRRIAQTHVEWFRQSFVDRHGQQQSNAAELISKACCQLPHLGNKLRARSLESGCCPSLVNL